MDLYSSWPESFLGVIAPAMRSPSIETRQGASQCRKTHPALLDLSEKQLHFAHVQAAYGALALQPHASSAFTTLPFQFSMPLPRSFRSHGYESVQARSESRQNLPNFNVLCSLRGSSQIEPPGHVPANSRGIDLNGLGCLRRLRVDPPSCQAKSV